jgi:hypothetical protein
MKVILVDTAPALCEQWRGAFEGVRGVTVHQSRFEQRIGQFDCLPRWGILDEREFRSHTRTRGELLRGRFDLQD